MFQDIAPYVLHNEWELRAPKTGDLIIYSEGEKVFMRLDNDRVILPSYDECKDLGEFRFLLKLDERGIYMLFPKNEINMVEKLTLLGYELKDKFTFRGKAPNEIAFAASVAFHLTSFYEKNKYCGACGSAYRHSEKERALICPKCNQHLYPRINPAMIVAITDGDKILLSKYAGGYYNRYALVAGYAEIGETIEQTVHREVMEETGLKVKNVRYFTSQPWPFTQSLLIGFFAELDGSPEVTLDDGELSVAEWFKREDIPKDDSTLSMTKTMIEYFRAHPEEFK